MKTRYKDSIFYINLFLKVPHRKLKKNYGQKYHQFSAEIILFGLYLLMITSTLKRKGFGRLCVLCGARTQSDVRYRRELEKWRGRLDVQVEVTVDRGDSSWHGEVGVVTQLLERAQLDPARTVAMVCGPEVMMHFSRLALVKRGVPESQIFVSMERNMKCGVGSCGHCQLGPFFICKYGPVFDYPRIAPVFSTKEL